jgi:UDP-glucuronate 4-epimerase
VRPLVLNILVTGAAGFIGFHVARRLLDEGARVVGVDNLNSYYDVSLKEARLRLLGGSGGFQFQKRDVSDPSSAAALFDADSFDYVVHLAAQAGVRYSLENPRAYVESNILGFFNVLEGCRGMGVKHLVFASTSSVYGGGGTIPYSVGQKVDRPLSMYAASKVSNELMAHVYAALHGLPSTGLRFFTVYGPWGRPDMAYYRFTKSMLEGNPIDVYNYGNMKRDFTYIDDIVEGVFRVMGKPPEGDTPFRLFNIGHNVPVALNAFIDILEEELGVRAERRPLPLQAGDMVETCADIGDLERETGYRPKTDIREGLKRFVGWYREYYDVPIRSRPGDGEE